MWDDEWDEDPDDFYNYRHQRRLSDPSASLNNFSRYAFRAKGSHEVTAGGKARSENEGLDNLVSEVSEIEAGDLRDGKLNFLLDYFCFSFYIFNTHNFILQQNKVYKLFLFCFLYF